MAVGTARFVLPLLLAGAAVGILGSDRGWISNPALLALAGAGLVALGLVLGARAAPIALGGILVLGAAIGAWRQADVSDATGPSLATLAGRGEQALTGVLADDPRPRGDRLQFVLQDVRPTEGRSGDGTPFAERLLVWLPRGPDLRSGDRAAIHATVELAEDFDGFAYREYLERQGIGAVARARSVQVLPGRGGPAAAMAALRATLLGGLTRSVPEPEAALGAGILLGVRSAIAPEINDAFATAGLTHVVAISGWNIAIVAALVMAMCRPLERRPGGRWTTALVVASIVGCYVILTGASPSVVRAALMAGAMLVGRLGGSRAHASSALGLAALVMLLVAPSVLWDVGFQLSLLATAGLIWFGASIERRLAAWPFWIREPVALTLAAQLTTLPVILINFERLSLVAPLSNVLVVPLVPLAMLASATASVGGVLGAAVSIEPLAGALTWLLGGAAWLVLRGMIVIGELTAGLPFAAVDASLPAPLAVAWFPLLALAAWALRSPDAPPGDARRVPDEAMSATMAALARLARPLPASAVLAAVLVTITIATGPDGRLHVTALSVGQGDAILVETPDGRRMLVDGGPDPELTLRRLGAAMPFHARQIDVLVVSHPHQDHVAGLVDVLGRFRVGMLLHAGIPFENAANDRLLADGGARRVPTLLARSGMQLSLGGEVVVEVLYPSEADAAAPLPDGDINNGSVVLLIRHGGFSALLTGDAEAPVESALVGRAAIPLVDVLKVGHHGSHSSTTPALLAAADPRVALISSGVDNEYGHPAAETLAALEAVAGIAVHRTDLEGDIEVATDGRSFQVGTNAGWSEPRPTRGSADAGSIDGWPSRTATPYAGCSTKPTCPRASASTPPAWLAWPRRGPGSWRRPAFRSMAGSWRLRRCSTTSTSPRSDGPAGSTALSARAASKWRASKSSRCRSPPTRSSPSSTRIAFRSAGPRSSWPSQTGTLPSAFSPWTSAWTT